MKQKEVEGLLVIASVLDRKGMFAEADLLTSILKTAKEPSAVNYQSPSLLAESLYKIVRHLMYRANPEKQQGYLQSVQRALAKINPLELAQKSPNPSTAIGAAINVVKNVLIGQHPSTIAAVLSALSGSL